MAETSRTQGKSAPDPVVRLPSQDPDEFRQLAALFMPDPPSWLKETLRNWVSTIFVADQIVERRQPHRTTMVKQLREFGSAAIAVVKGLSTTSLREYLDAGGDGPTAIPNDFLVKLRELIERADTGAGHPSLVDEHGKTNVGTGRASPTPGISSKTYCALLVAETWKWLFHSYPAPRNRVAAEIADRWWLLAGGEKQGKGSDPLGFWRTHFKSALNLQGTPEQIEYRRHLHESERLAGLALS